MAQYARVHDEKEAHRSQRLYAVCVCSYSALHCQPELKRPNKDSKRGKLIAYEDSTHDSTHERQRRVFKEVNTRSMH